MKRNETATLADPTRHDEVVREAWAAIALVQDNIARLAEAVERSRVLCARARELQDRALRFRYRDPRPPGDDPGPARRKIGDE